MIFLVLFTLANEYFKVLFRKKEILCDCDCDEASSL